MLETCLQDLVEAMTSVESKSNKHEITMKLNSAIDAVMKLDQIDEIFELPYVSPDQFFAIFGSLIFPLLAPMIKNGISEMKRLKALKK